MSCSAAANEQLGSVQEHCCAQGAGPGTHTPTLSALSNPMDAAAGWKIRSARCSQRTKAPFLLPV